MIGVYYETLQIGSIDPDAGHAFEYEAEWLSTPGAFPLSLRFPLNDEPVSGAEIEIWLANLLPEERNLTTIARQTGHSPGDVFGLIQQLGGETAGALSFGAHAQAVEDFREIEPRDLERVLNELPRRPFLVGEEGVSLSLTGGQDKLPVALLDNGSWAIPLAGASSTHILKPDNSRLPGIVENEALCLTLAAAVGLNAASCETRRAGQRKYLAVKRYDRTATDKRVRRLHQEDFGQILGYPPQQKYERATGGGPGLRDLYSVANYLPARDRLALVDSFVFNILIGNTDAHAKNYSVLFKPDRQGQITPVLAPLYDLLCARCWPEVNRYFAQNIAGTKRPMSGIFHRHWEAVSQSLGLNPTLLLRRVERLADDAFIALPDAVKRLEAGEGTDPAVLRHVSEAVQKSILTVSANARK